MHVSKTVLEDEYRCTVTQFGKCSGVHKKAEVCWPRGDNFSQ